MTNWSNNEILPEMLYFSNPGVRLIQKAIITNHRSGVNPPATVLFPIFADGITFGSINGPSRSERSSIVTDIQADQRFEGFCSRTIHSENHSSINGEGSRCFPGVPRCKTNCELALKYSELPTPVRGRSVQPPISPIRGFSRVAQIP